MNNKDHLVGQLTRPPPNFPSGEAHFEPTAHDIRVYNSSGTYRVCKQIVRWNTFPVNDPFFTRSNCCQESKNLVEGCEEERESGCKEIFGGNKPLQALSFFLFFFIGLFFYWPGIVQHQSPKHLVSQKVPRMSILLPPHHPLSGAAQRPTGGEVLQADWAR